MYLSFFCHLLLDVGGCYKKIVKHALPNICVIGCSGDSGSQHSLIASIFSATLLFYFWSYIFNFYITPSSNPHPTQLALHSWIVAVLSMELNQYLPFTSLFAMVMLELILDCYYRPTYLSCPYYQNDLDAELLC